MRHPGQTSMPQPVACLMDSGQLHARCTLAQRAKRGIAAGTGGSQEGRSVAPVSCRSIADFNFDHPHAFAFDEIVECLRSLKQGRPVQIPQVTHLQQGLLPAAACCMSCFSRSCASAGNDDMYLACGAACIWWRLICLTLFASCSRRLETAEAASCACATCRKLPP